MKKWLVKSGKLHTVFSLKSGTDWIDLFEWELENPTNNYTVFSLKSGTDSNDLFEKELEKNLE